MNIKWMVVIVMILVVASIVISLTVPKKVNADGTISTFNKKDSAEEPTAIEEAVQEIVKP